jgi:hypothetical protein
MSSALVVYSKKPVSPFKPKRPRPPPLRPLPRLGPGIEGWKKKMAAKMILRKLGADYRIQ